MIHLNVHRSFSVKVLTNNITRAFCTKLPSNENVTVKDEIKNNSEDKNTTKGSATSQDISDKINLILKGMIENSSKTKESSELKKKLPVDDYELNANKKSRQATLFHKNPENAIRNAAASIAESLGNDKEVESELISKALEHQTPEIANLNWNDLIKGMQIDKTKNTDDYVGMSSRAQQVQYAMTQKKKSAFKDPFQPRARTTATPFLPKLHTIDLFGGEPLGLFKKENAGETVETQLTMWKELEEYEKEMCISHAPANYYEKMINWTKQGKIWKFPIDNEQDMDERFVHFSEHVFMEPYLEGWCPDKGPIRHFMELVCVGLSKNPFMTVKDKKESVLWFKDYFDSKRELLEQVGVYGNVMQQQITESKA